MPTSYSMVILVRSFQKWVISHIQILLRVQELSQLPHFPCTGKSLSTPMNCHVSRTWHKLNPHKSPVMPVLLTPFYDENLGPESRLFSCGVTALGFAPDLMPQLLPSTIPTDSCVFWLLPSRAVPPYAISSVFSSIYFMGICPGSLRRLNFLMEGTMSVSFLYPPDSNYCCRET